MATIAEMKLRQYLIELQKKEKLTNAEMLKMLDRQKKHFRKTNRE